MTPTPETRMKVAHIVAAALLLLVLSHVAPSLAQSIPREHRFMTTSTLPAGYHRATGSFEITMSAHPPYDSSDGITIGRTTINKRFHGALDGTSVVEMLSAMTGVKGSAGYVAIERVTGTLDGRSGAFVLQHSGTMTRGAPQLTISIVPDSGTGQLKGIAGTLTIDIVDGKHFYTLDYRLGEGT